MQLFGSMICDKCPLFRFEDYSLYKTSLTARHTLRGKPIGKGVIFPIPGKFQASDEVSGIAILVKAYKKLL
jgi:hypothetical protein